MQLMIRQIKQEEWNDAMLLVWRVFLRYNAAEYEEEGIHNFMDFITNDSLERLFFAGGYTVYGAFVEGTLIGVGSYRSGNHISLLFVDDAYHRKSVGSKLIEMICEEIASTGLYDAVTVDASPYATEFYHKIGFVDVNSLIWKDGICYTPMRKKIPKKRT